MNKELVPLEGLLVIDFTQAFSGPFCTMNLADYGARVIKIEQVGNGDMLRAAGPYDENHKSLYFPSGNRGKESIEIDLKDVKDRELIKTIIEKADILVENFRPGVMDKLGFGYAVVKNINSKIIYASISGFGHTGPKCMEPGFDMIAQGYSGIMSVNGEDNSNSLKIGISIGDIVGGMYAYMAIVTALYAREKNGIGTHVDIAMLDSLFSLLALHISNYTATGRIGVPSGNAHPQISPFGSVLTMDSEVIVTVLGDKLWHAFCISVGKPELEKNKHFSTNELRIKNRGELRGILRPHFKTKTSKEWIDVFHKFGIPCAKVNNIREACEMDQIAARNMLCKSGDYILAGNPMKMSAYKDSYVKGKVPELGEHTYAVRKEFSKEQA
jgi:CoA:oxalate CoA-transferase